MKNARCNSIIMLDSMRFGIPAQLHIMAAGWQSSSKGKREIEHNKSERKINKEKEMKEKDRKTQQIFVLQKMEVLEMCVFFFNFLILYTLFFYNALYMCQSIHSIDLCECILLSSIRLCLSLFQLPTTHIDYPSLLVKIKELNTLIDMSAENWNPVDEHKCLEKHKNFMHVAGKQQKQRVLRSSFIPGGLLDFIFESVHCFFFGPL